MYNMPIPAILHDKQKILVVDDDLAVIDLIKRALSKDMPDKVDVKVSQDGFDAGKQVGVFHPDLVILDLKLPEVDGFQVCKNIKKDS